jgi:hypothetical protein
MQFDSNGWYEINKNQIRQFIKQIQELSSDCNIFFLAMYQVDKRQLRQLINIPFMKGWVNISVTEQTLLEEMMTSKTSEVIYLLNEMTKPI